MRTASTSVLVLLGCLALSGVASRAAATSCSPWPTRIVAPSTGVPRNARLFVRLGYHESLRATLPSIRLTGPSGRVAIGVTSDTGVPAADVRVGRQLVIVPSAPLAASTAYTLSVGRVRAHFVTSSSDDTTPPVLTSFTATSIPFVAGQSTSEEVYDLAIGADADTSRVELRVTRSSGAVTTLQLDPPTAGHVTIASDGCGPSFSLAAGESADLALVAYDLAGNASPTLTAHLARP